MKRDCSYSRSSLSPAHLMLHKPPRIPLLQQLKPTAEELETGAFADDQLVVGQCGLQTLEDRFVFPNPEVLGTEV